MYIGACSVKVIIGGNGFINPSSCLFLLERHEPFCSLSSNVLIIVQTVLFSHGKAISLEEEN